MALEDELVGEELSRYNLSAAEIEMEAKAYRVGINLPEMYLCTAGLATVEEPDEANVSRPVLKPSGR